jgi:hypothetical protein
MCRLIRAPKGPDLRFGMSLPSAKTMFTGNQCVLDLAYEPASQPLSSVTIISTDDLAFNDNQSDCDESPLQQTIVHAILAAMTVRMADNRLTESWVENDAVNPFGHRLSALTFGVLNATTNNQTTHCIHARAAASRLLVYRGNRALLSAFCADYCDTPESALQSGAQ